MQKGNYSMRTKAFLILAIALLLLGGSALAQDQAPKAELFGGYSYVRTAGNFNINGWNAQAAFNVNHWFGVAADLSGHYQTRSENYVRKSAALTNFMFGPQFSDRVGRITGFAHVLVGGAHVDEGLLLRGGATPKASTNFAMALGGGIDANVNGMIAVRLFQVDYLRIRAENASTKLTEGQTNIRVSVGVVFKIK
jgi:opacity protein-like surface antigen